MLQSSAVINGTIPVSKYKTKTGIQIVIAKTDGPLVKGYYTLGNTLIYSVYLCMMI